MKSLAAEGKACNGIKINAIKLIIPLPDEMIAMMERLNGQLTSNEWLVMHSIFYYPIVIPADPSLSVLSVSETLI